jgi:hypothetical protein
MIDLQVASPILREIVDTCRLQDVPAGGSLDTGQRSSEARAGCRARLRPCHPLSAS